MDIGGNKMVVATKRQRKIRKADIEHEKETEEKAQKDRQKSPYKKWTQVNNSREAYEAEDWLIANSPTAYRILKFLVSNMDRHNAVICSYKVMQEKLRLSRTTVADAIKFLKEHKFINAVRTGGIWSTRYFIGTRGAVTMPTQSLKRKLLSLHRNRTTKQKKKSNCKLSGALKLRSRQRKRIRLNKPN